MGVILKGIFGIFVLISAIIVLSAMIASFAPPVDTNEPPIEVEAGSPDGLVEAQESTSSVSSVTPPSEPEVVEPDVISLSGDGQEATSKFTLEKGLSIFRMKHDGSSNFAIWLMDDNGYTEELLVNEIGEFDGAKAVGISKGGTYLLDIAANGDWTIDIEQPRNPASASAPLTLKGEGQQVPELFHLDAGLTIFKMKHDGRSNFAIWLMDDNGYTEELLVNEIGDFDGSKAVGIARSGTYLLDISADGDWRVSIE